MNLIFELLQDLVEEVLLQANLPQKMKVLHCKLCFVLSYMVLSSLWLGR